MSFKRLAIIAASLLAAASSAQADDGTIFEGIADIPRISTTGPVDGCSTVTKGLINNGGFLLFTCEKLLPYHPISAHAASFANYQSVLRQNGWTRKGGDKKNAKYVRTDSTGCETQLEMTLWTDRSMNEFPARPASDRNAHRQIVFKAKFFGVACDHYYPLAQAMASR
ncbi:MAG: hypothetical protein HKN36_08870 [Hellea sp.]|nr:hypothetical protein [Hellea sp.]